MNYVSIDVETCGIEPGSRLVEVAALEFDPVRNGVPRGFGQLVDPSMPVPEDAAKVHGITTEVLRNHGAVYAGDVVEALLDWLPDDPCIVMHNAPFDVGVLAYEMGMAGLTIDPATPVIDTLAIARRLNGRDGNSLAALCERHGIVHEQEHRAYGDADATRRYFSLLFRTAPAAITNTTWGEIAAKCATYVEPDALPPCLEALPAAVREGAPFKFVYTDSKGEVTQRAITPYGWAMTGRGLMFHGWCHLRDERRSFYADRVQRTGNVFAPAGEETEA